MREQELHKMEVLPGEPLCPVFTYSMLVPGYGGLQTLLNAYQIDKKAAYKAFL